MANLVIVSSHCYLLCEAINHITLDDCDNESYDKVEYLTKSKKSGRSGKLSKKKEMLNLKKWCKITLNYVPATKSQNSRGDDIRSVEILIQGKEIANTLYKEIISQIREQMPDQLFLDKLVDNILQGEK